MRRDTAVAGARAGRFIFHTGHNDSLPSLQHAQSMATDEALWTAIRALPVKQLLLQKPADSLEAEGETAQAAKVRAGLPAIERLEQLLRGLVEAVA